MVSRHDANVLPGILRDFPVIEPVAITAQGPSTVWPERTAESILVLAKRPCREQLSISFRRATCP